MTTTTITWTPVGPMTMPDADTNVLLGLSDKNTCEGFWDGSIWRDSTAWPIDEATEATVVAWADMPRCEVAGC